MDEETAVRIQVAAPDTAADSAGAGLRRVAAAAPDAIAIADAPNRPELGLGPARTLTYKEADAAADRIAAHLSGCGLKSGSAVTLQLPNIAEAPLMLAGIWRAGLVACPLPLLWRSDELHHAFAQIEPAAIVTVAEFAGHGHAAALAEAAAQHVCVRYIFGIGGPVPDGVTPVDHLFSGHAAQASGAHEKDAGTAASPGGTAIMTWGTSPQGVFPVPRTHSELLALSELFVQELGINGSDVLLNAYPLTAALPVAGQMLAAFATGATLVLHHPFDFEVFLRQLREEKVTYTQIPAPVIAAMKERGALGVTGHRLARIGCVWPAPHETKGSLTDDLPLPVIDIHTLGEIAAVPCRREPDTDPATLPLGKLTAPGGDGEPVVYLETRIRGSVTNGGTQKSLQGRLYARGATVPAGPLDAAGALAQSLLQPDAQGFIDCRIRGVVDEAVTGRFRCLRNDELIYHGGVAIAAGELDRLYADYPEFLDAAAFSIDDAVMGERIFAAIVPRPDLSPSLDEFKKFLTSKGVAPYKLPDQLVVVNMIPREADGRIRRGDILSQV